MRVEPGRSRSTERGRRGSPPSAPTDPFRLGTARALFLRLAGATTGPTGLKSSASAAALAAAAPDWADVRALARREGVTAALWPRLRRTLDMAGGATIPVEVEEAFQREAMVAEFGARRLEARLQEVLQVLAGCGVEPVLLKGAGLAYSAFGGMARRPMRDLDLLVPREAMAPAMAALRTAGWEPAPGQRGAERYAAHQHAEPLVAPGGGEGVVELHDSLFPPGHPFQLDGSAVIGRARRLPSPVGAVLVPVPVDQLLHACLHFAWSHELRWGAWRAVADVAALVGAAAAEDAAAVDGSNLPTTRALDEMVESARTAGGESAAYWTLRLAAALGEVPVPEPWLAGLATGGWGESTTLLERHLVHQLLPGPGNAPSVVLARAGWSAALRPRRSGHGSSRPWLVGTSREGAEGVPASQRLDGLVRQLTTPARWRRYLSSLLG